MDVNATDDQGNTGLHWACARGILNIVIRLCEKEADVNLKNKQVDTDSSRCVVPDGDWPRELPQCTELHCLAKLRV